MSSVFRCIGCGNEYRSDGKMRCSCGEIVEVVHQFPKIERSIFDSRLSMKSKPYCSGVWRFKELVHPGIDESDIFSRPEGNTNIYSHRRIEEYVGLKELSLKHEGENPTGSFKDRGMA